MTHEETVKYTAVPIWSIPIRGFELPWPIPYGEYLPERARNGTTWPLIQRLFDLPDPSKFPAIAASLGGGAEFKRCRRFLENCRDYADLSYHATGARVSLRSTAGEVEVDSHLPSAEALRAASATFRLLYSSEDSSSFPKVHKVIAHALHRHGGSETIQAHKRWVDVHNKELLQHPIKRSSERLYYGSQGTSGDHGLPPVDAPRDVIKRYMYARHLHNNEDHETALPPADDEFWHPHGVIGYLDDMDQLGMFYLGYGEIVSRVTGLGLDGR